MPARLRDTKAEIMKQVRSHLHHLVWPKEEFLGGVGSCKEEEVEHEQDELHEELDLEEWGRVIWKDSGVSLSFPHRKRSVTFSEMLVLLVLALVLSLSREEARLWLLGKVTTG